MTSIHKHDGCAICHEAFSSAVPDICRVLDCSHVFHAKCVDLWFIKATFCPLCKSDLKLTYRNTSSQRSLGRSSHTSSQMSLGQGSHSSSLRSGQILVGHSNSDPALLRILQEHPHTLGLQHPTSRSPPATPELVRQGGSTPSLNLSYSDRSLPVMGSSRSERSVGILSSSSSGALPAVQELSDEARFADDSQRSQSSNPPSPQTMSPGMQTTNRGQTEGTRDEFLPTLLPTSQPAPNGASAGPAQSSQEINEGSTPAFVSGMGSASAGTASDEVSERENAKVLPDFTGTAGAEWKTVEHYSTVLTVPRSSSWIFSRSNVGILAAANANLAAAKSAIISMPQGAGGSVSSAVGSTTSSTNDGDSVCTVEGVNEGSLRPAVPAAPQPRSREIFGDEAAAANVAEHNRKGVTHVPPPPGQVLHDVDVASTSDMTMEEDLRRNRSSSAPPDKTGEVCPTCSAVKKSTPPGSMTLGTGAPVHPASAPISLPASPSMSATATAPTATNRGASPSWVTAGAATGQRPGYPSAVQTTMATPAVSAAAATSAAAAHVASVPAPAAAGTGSGAIRPGSAKAVFNAWSFTNPAAASTAPSADAAAAAGGAGQKPRVAAASVTLSVPNHTSLQS